MPGLFRGVKRPGRGLDHPTPSSAEVKERVDLYLYSPYGTSWPVLHISSTNSNHSDVSTLPTAYESAVTVKRQIKAWKTGLRSTVEDVSSIFRPDWVHSVSIPYSKDDEE